MKRSERMAVGKQTVELVEQGQYATANGRTVEISHHVRQCLKETRPIWPDKLQSLRQQALDQPPRESATTIEVVNETTLEGITRQLAAGRTSIAALNFASAKNPGGGFLNGSQAQEESLARSSALYASLTTVPEFYDRHRNLHSAFYTDAMILSPACPIIRNDAGDLLDEPQLVTFITSPAPNAGAIGTNHPADSHRIPDILRQRADYVLALAASQGYRVLILGAWGCGVFRNDPRLVARIFMEHLNGPWSRRFDRVVFSVYDMSPGLETFRAFDERVSRSR